MRTPVLIVAFTSRLAFAGHQYEETDAEKVDDVAVVAADAAPHAQYGIGFRAGSFHVGSIYDIGFGFGLEAGVRIGRLQLLGDYTLFGLTTGWTQPQSKDSSAAMTTTPLPDGTTPPHPGGVAQRLAAIARYSPARFMEAQHGVGVRGDIFVEGGIGEQLIEWSGGGYLHRTDISLGAGFSIQFRGPHHHGGYYLGARVVLADPPSGAQMPTGATCAGPCDGPSQPIQIDRSVEGMFTVIFGD